MGARALAARLLALPAPGRCVRRCSSGAPIDSQPPPLVLSSRLGTITTIALNKPERRNCLDAETIDQLSAALRRFEADASSPVAVLHGRGGNFSAGCDLAALAAADSDDAAVERLHAVWRRPCAKPVVAAIDGYAVGSGLELALWCDLRVVEETAELGALGRRFGVPLSDGGAARLPALIGLSRSLDLILTGRMVNGAEAHQWGLSNRLVACGTALGQAIQLASSIGKFPAAAAAADRAAAYYAAYEAGSLDEALQYERENGRPLLAEAREGARRFVEDGIGRGGKSNIHPEKLEEWKRR